MWSLALLTNKGPWANDFTFLGLSFLICKMGQHCPPHNVVLSLHYSHLRVFFMSLLLISFLKGKIYGFFFVVVVVLRSMFNSSLNHISYLPYTAQRMSSVKIGFITLCCQINFQKHQFTLPLIIAACTCFPQACFIFLI